MVQFWLASSSRIGAGLLGGVIAFCGWMAFVAYRGSREVGAGAAQGDLGFFMVLLVVSPVVLLLTAFSWWLVSRQAVRTVRVGSTLANWLGATSLLALGWNWLYLFLFWKA
jgi:hypothetical protein